MQADMKALMCLIFENIYGPLSQVNLTLRFPEHSETPSLLGLHDIAWKSPLTGTEKGLCQEEGGGQALKSGSGALCRSRLHWGERNQQVVGQVTWRDTQFSSP